MYHWNWYPRQVGGSEGPGISDPYLQEEEGRKAVEHCGKKDSCTLESDKVKRMFGFSPYDTNTLVKGEEESYIIHINWIQPFNSQPYWHQQ